jgi:lipopolysaccharide/colanic/teichoic acid biosynthesis glycosyltransferase
VTAPPTTHSAGAHVSSLVERYAHMAHTFERRPVDRVLRLLDLILGSLLLLLAGPVILVAAVAVTTTDGGPAFYRGRRVGRAGVIFTMYKLRTLHADAETRLGTFLGAELTFRTNAEHTPVGRILRATKVDELPQLYNVVRGDMSLVGPRPIRPAFFEELCQEIPQYWQRLVVRPGITGPAQLRLTREMSWAEKLAHDFEYIADRSGSLYLRIVVDTAWDLVREVWNQ